MRLFEKSFPVIAATPMSLSQMRITVLGPLLCWRGALALIASTPEGAEAQNGSVLDPVIKHSPVRGPLRTRLVVGTMTSKKQESIRRTSGRQASRRERLNLV